MHVYPINRTEDVAVSLIHHASLWSEAEKQPSNEIAYISNGCGQYVFAGSATPVAAGSLIVIPPHAQHCFQMEAMQPMRMYRILFASSQIVTAADAWTSGASLDWQSIRTFMPTKTTVGLHFVLSPHERLEIERRLELLVEEAKTKDSGYRLSIKALFLELLIWLSRRAQLQPRSVPMCPSEMTIARKLCNYVKTNYSSNTPLKQLCQMFHFGMCISSVRQQFKQVVKKSFTDYRNEVRIHMSLEQLRDSDRLIIDVAHRVGFNDLSHFNRLFKRYTGITPNQYRQRMRD